MIQRIQSLYLLAVMLLSVSLFLIPIYTLETATGSVAYYASSNTVYMLLNIATAAFAAIILFLFKNRNLQVRLCNLQMLVICIFTGTIFYFADHSKADSSSLVHYNLGCYVPLLQLVFTFLAMRAIRKDEELVRSADRLR